jgi:hypothetical protein
VQDLDLLVALLAQPLPRVDLCVRCCGFQPYSDDPDYGDCSKVDYFDGVESLGRCNQWEPVSTALPDFWYIGAYL